ncbi:hypothetical protein V8B55DRAFT_1578093 [Mucor lusitanicus]
MAKKRRYQETQFTSNPNKPPEFRRVGQRSAPVTATTTPSAKDISIFQAWKAFEDGLREVLIQRIKGARLDKKPLNKLKKELQNETRILRYTYSNADRIHKLKANTTRAKENFDTIAQSSESLPTPHRTPGAPEGRQQTTATTPKQEFKAVTTTFSSIIRRQDISDERWRHFQQRLSEATEDVSNHIIDFGVQVLRLITMFKTHTFQLQGDDFQFVPSQASFTMQDILPPRYHNEETPHPPLPPLWPNNEEHLSRINTTYLGIGISDNTLAKYPLDAAITARLPRPQDVPPIRFSSARAVARNLYSTNFDNLWSLKGRFTKVFNKLLTILVKIHLAPDREAKYQDYLKKQKQGQEKKTTSAQEANTGNFSFAGKKRNQVRCIFGQERKNQQRYNQKAKTMGGKWIKRARRSAECLQTYAFTRYQEKRQSIATATATQATMNDDNTEAELEVLSQTNPAAITQLDEVQDSQQAKSTDLTAREIRQLVATIRNVIFQHSGQAQITAKQFRDVEASVNGHQLDVCLNIINRLLPYIPATKRTWFSKMHQIPFILLANEVFRAAGYDRFAVKLANIPSTSTLAALHLDVTSIYSIFSVDEVKGRTLDLFSYTGEAITSRSTALSNADAVFHSIFDLAKINSMMDLYKLQFYHRIVLLPGFKTVRILGTKRTAATVHSARATSIAPQDLPPKPVEKKNLTVAEKKDIENKITTQQAEERGEFLRQYYQDIKSYKSLFPTKTNPPTSQGDTAEERILQGTRDEYHQYINQLKQTRDDFNRTIMTTRKELAEARYQLYLRRRTTSTTPTSESVPSTTMIKQITSSNYECYEKAENVRLPENLAKAPNMCFAGTDNGIVTTTETSRFNMQRFQFHLKLANKFDVLQDLEDNPELIQVPKTFKTYAKDIDFKTGAKKQRQRLLRDKSSTKGQAVQASENICSQNSLHDAQNINDLNERYQAQLEHREAIRQFYYTQTRAKQKRKYEYIKRKQIDLLCSQERQYVNNYNSKSQTVLFIGNRGTGVGSRIKGHLRYGGHWKSKTHARYTSVCVTNEYHSSQTCPYCFQKTTHPVRLVNGKLITINGTSVCCNPNCLLVRSGRSHQPRDSLSALVIGLSGLCTVLSGTTFPALDPKRISHFNTDFQQFAGSFLTRNLPRPAV